MASQEIFYSRYQRSKHLIGAKLMKIRKTFECGNDWSVEISKPHKLTLQVSLFKKTNKGKK